MDILKSKDTRFYSIIIETNEKKKKYLRNFDGPLSLLYYLFMSSVTFFSLYLKCHFIAVYKVSN